MTGLGLQAITQPYPGFGWSLRLARRALLAAATLHCHGPDYARRALTQHARGTHARRAAGLRDSPTPKSPGNRVWRQRPTQRATWACERRGQGASRARNRVQRTPPHYGIIFRLSLILDDHKWNMVAFEWRKGWNTQIRTPCGCPYDYAYSCPLAVNPAANRWLCCFPLPSHRAFAPWLQGKTY